MSTIPTGTTEKRNANYGFEEEEEDSAPPAAKIKRAEQSQSCYAAYKKSNVSKPTQSDAGQIQDYKHELHYILTTLFDEKSLLNLRSLSLTQLNKKAVASQFRNFLRIQITQLNKLFGVLCELSSSQEIALSAACLLYLMARDQKSIPVTENCLRLFSELLKQDQLRAKVDPAHKKHAALVWSILQDWLKSCESKSSRSVQFEVTAENLSASYLALEALAYIATRERSHMFKSHLLNTGCLTSVVAKLDKVVLELVHSAPPYSLETDTRLKIVERCFRILENAAAFDINNQKFLIQHRNNILIFSGAKFLNFSLKFIGSVSQSPTEQSTSKTEVNQVFECICLLCRVLMNVSHENENASQKIGQVGGFLGNCLSLLAQHSKYAPKDKFFDLCCMMYGLLVNLLERCSANRRKFISSKAAFLDEADGITNDVPSLEILTKLFIRHDSAAKIIDEELDNELAVEENEEMDEYDEGYGSAEGNGQLSRAPNMSEDEIIAAVQMAMRKASTHMEDSMIASYCSLVVAILVGTDERLAEQLKGLLSNGDVRPMIEQLERFLEFMQITKAAHKLKEGTVKNIERLIKSFEAATASVQ